MYSEDPYDMNLGISGYPTAPDDDSSSGDEESRDRTNTYQGVGNHWQYGYGIDRGVHDFAQMPHRDIGHSCHDPIEDDQDDYLDNDQDEDHFSGGSYGKSDQGEDHSEGQGDIDESEDVASVSSQTLMRSSDQSLHNIYAAQASVNNTEGNYKRTRLEENMDKFDDRLDSAIGSESKFKSGFETLAPAIQEAIVSSKAGRELEDTVDDFIYGIPEFIAVLGFIGKIHPFIDVVVNAFTTVYNHEKARRSNDQKIKVVFVEMKEMLRVLFRLKDVGDIAEEDEKRLKELSSLAADDIKSCGNTCDTYAKKSFGSKLVFSRSWDRRFTEYIQLFQERRKELDSALSMGSALAVFQIEHKVDDVLKLLRATVTPEQRKYKKLLLDCKGNDEKLKAALKDHPSLYMSDIEVKSKASDRELATKKLNETMAELKQSAQDMRMDEEKNRKKFEQLFDLQMKQVESVKNVVKRESDRTIDEITKAIHGPVDKIVDKDIYTIWVEGGWKGNVKARHFILALRDYFHEKDEADRKARGQFVNQPSADKWAYQYIDVPYLQPILEAVDDDASGFIRISEVNVFTTSRPKDWSLVRWIAFWAVGWYASVRKECSKINDLFGDMFSILPDMKKENQSSAEEYLMTVWKVVSELTMSLASKTDRSKDLDNRFSAYLEEEEKRLKDSLESISYDIDDLGTLEAVIGSGRVEKNMFLLLRLILEQHLKYFKVCKEFILHPHELVDASDSILCVMEAVHGRYEDLKTLFANQRLDAKYQFRTFEYGIFKYIDDPQSLWPGGLSVCDRTDGAAESDSASECSSEYSGDSEFDSEHGSGEVQTRDDTENKEASDNDPSILIYGPQETADLDDPEDNFGFVCDCCSEAIEKNRIICLDCLSSDGLWSTVDLCTKPRCVRNQTIVGRSDLLREHNNQHNLLLLGQIPHVYLVLLAFLSDGEDNIYKLAMKKIKQTQNSLGFIRNMAESNEQVSYQIHPVCIGCKSPVALPCWTCIFCPDDEDDGESEVDVPNTGETEKSCKETSNIYICSDCITDTEGFDDRYHMFVKCPAEVQDDGGDSIESIVTGLAARLSQVEEGQKRLEDLLGNVMDRLDRILHGFQ